MKEHVLNAVETLIDAAPQDKTTAIQVILHKDYADITAVSYVEREEIQEEPQEEECDCDCKCKENGIKEILQNMFGKDAKLKIHFID